MFLGGLSSRASGINEVSSPFSLLLVLSWDSCFSSCNGRVQGNIVCWSGAGFIFPTLMSIG